MSRRFKIWGSFVLIVLVAVLAALVVYPTGPDINLSRIHIAYQKEIKAHLGLDLQGGSHLVYEADLSQVQAKDYQASMDGLREVIERRVNGFGVSEPVVQTISGGQSHQLIVELPGVQDVKQAIDSIGQTPLLQFDEVIDIPAEVKAQLGDNAQSGQQLSPTELSGRHLSGAEVAFDQQTGEPLVTIEFNAEGTKLFAEITKRNIGKPVAILLDGVVISAPRVSNEIVGGKAQITGNFTVPEARDLAKRLKTGALPVPIHLVQQTTVGPTLGQASIEKSLLAGIIGMALICVFMILFYRLPGLLAVCGLVLYALIVVALFKLIPVVLTIAGIAGFILSLGIAVDANVLVFERMREELAKGKDLAIALEDGFSYAWSSIRDSNVSGLITCLILAWFGSSVVRGFAITLAIGIGVSLFTAIIVSRTLLRLCSGKWMGRHLWLFGRGLSARRTSSTQENIAHV